MNRADLKNPFYRIEVISFDKKRKAMITENIHRLITSVQIQESSATGEGDATNQLQLEFTQTDYLPQDGGLRPQDPKVFGELTNRPNAVADLRFDSEKGFTFVSQEELQTGITESRRTQTRIEEPIIFVFQPHNYIDITWGYLEPHIERKRRFKIISVDMDGGTSGMKTTVMATDMGFELEKHQPTTGIVFQTAPYLPPELPFRTGDKPLSLQQTLFRIAKGFGAKLVFDDVELIREPEGTDTFEDFRTYGSDSAPVEKAFRIPKGLDYRKFINKLAADFDSIVEYDTDEEGNNIIRFTHTENFFSKVQHTFEYMNPNGLLKTYKINALDAYNVVKATISNLQADDNLYVTEQLVKVEGNEEEREFPMTISPEGENRIEEGIGKKSAGKSITHPSDDPRALAQTADTVIEDDLHTITANFTSVGYPLFKPSAIEVNNIGARYSGTYRAYTVTHNLTPNGYDCEFVTQRFTIETGGISKEAAAADNGLIEVQLTEGTEE